MGDPTHSRPVYLRRRCPAALVSLRITQCLLAGVCGASVRLSGESAGRVRVHTLEGPTAPHGGCRDVPFDPRRCRHRAVVRPPLD